MNAISVLAPYKHEGLWVFDDPSVGLVKEPFVFGIDTMIDRLTAGIPDAEQGFRLLFSPTPFPGYTIKLEWRREEYGGNWYWCPQLGIEGWLCPALFKYFAQAPGELYGRAEAKTAAIQTAVTGTELVQAFYHSFRSKNYERFKELCTPDLEWIQMPGFPGGGTWHGPDEVIAKVFQGNDGRWEGFGFEVSEYHDAGSTVTVVGTYRGTHRESGKSFAAPTVHLCDLREGRVWRFRQFTDTKLICDALP